VKDVFVVADAHGHHELVTGLMKQEGLIDDSLARVTDDVVVQIGDLCNCVGRSIDDDLACLELAPEWFDVLLIGNHEHPYFGGPRFDGFWRDPQVEHAIRRLPWQAAFPVGEFLVTHAGLGSSWGIASDGAKGAAWIVNNEWERNPGRHPFFAQIGRDRGGLDESGGILWADWQEPKSTAGFSQIVGHTPGVVFRVQGQPARIKDMKALGRDADDARFVDGRPEGFEPDEPFVLCIDLGGKHGERIGGAWIRETGVEPVGYVA
jgi:hypothetical protein